MPGLQVGSLEQLLRKMLKRLFYFSLLFTLCGGTMAHSEMPDVLEVRAKINAKCMSTKAITPEVAEVQDILIEPSQTPLRIYSPSTEGEHPLIILIHGGAWVAGNLDTHDNLARYFCREVGAVVISVGYKNAPEGKFPLQLEQCYAALVWATKNAVDLHLNGSAAVVGDSSGGNMAAALSMMARDLQGPPLTYQVLINPAPDLSCSGTLDPQNDELDFLRWQASMYVTDPKEVYHPYVSPLLADDLTNLPPALVIVAEHDNLRSDGEAYADKLRAAQVPTEIYCQMNTDHLAGHGARASTTALESLDVAALALRNALHAP